MSYILDALRRADSERERERSAVPGLHTQAVPSGTTEGEVDAPAHPWKWPIVAAFVALLGLVAWLWFGRADAPEPVAAAAPPTPAAALAPPPAPAAPPVTAPVAATAPPPVAPAGTAASSEPAPASARKPPASAPSAKKPAAAAATAAASAAAAPKTIAKASEPELKISALSELPDEVRRELPAITVGGSIYSKSAANRMLVINGQVFHEGDELAPGLVLEQIRQKAAVLKVKGYRYEITY